MNSSTIPSDTAIEELILENSRDHTTFLATIRACYQTRGIGNELSFEPIEAYWSDNIPLNEAWLDEFGRNVTFKQAQSNWGWSYREQVEEFRVALLSGLDPSQWFSVLEKSIYLLSPLLAAEHISYWLTFSNESGGKRFKAGVWSKNLFENLLPLTEAISNGNKAWRQLNLWMREAGSDPDLFHKMLKDFSTDDWQRLDAYCHNLKAHLVLLILAQLKLRQASIDGIRAAESLSSITTLLSDYSGAPFSQADHKALQQNHAKPFLKAALDSPDFNSHLIAQSDANPQLVSKLMNDLGLAVLLALQPERFRALIDNLDENTIRSLYPAKELCDLAPELAFYIDRCRYNQLGFLAFPEIDLAEAVAWYQSLLPSLSDERTISDCIKWLAPRQSQADTLSILDSFADREINLSGVRYAMEKISDVDALQRFLSCRNQSLRNQAAENLKQLAMPDDEGDPNPKYWSLLLELSKKHPDLFIEASIDYYDLRPQELERWELLWRSTTNQQSRISLVESLLNACRKDNASDNANPMRLADRLYQEDPTPFHAYIDEEDGGYMDSYINALGGEESSLWKLIPAMAASYLMQSTWLSGPIDKLDPAPVQRALVRYPDSFACLDEKAQIKLIPYFNDPALVSCGTTLAELFSKANKSLYPVAVQLIMRSSPEALHDSGLLGVSTKKARKLVLTGLGWDTDPETLPLLRQLIGDKAHDDFSRGLMLDNLQARGESVSEWDDWAELNTTMLQELASKQKYPAAITKLWNADLAECLGDLGEQGGLYLLHLLNQGDGERLPRRARQTLELLPSGRRADFAFLGVNQWISENGSDKLKLLLPPLFEYGDERAANALVKACKTWKKKRKPKSSAAIRLLCKMPGNYGIAQAHALWESRQFSESIMHNARQALTEAANREGLSFAEFVEQLVPDFGLQREGLVLDVGPYSYTVKIKPDLSLLVVNSKGKTTKSLPKAKPEEDADKRSLAENQFKALRSNLKPVLKQQSKRLARAFVAGKRWDLDLWRRTFAEHPLMAIIAQGIVWGAEDSEGCSIAHFRPTDTAELIDLHDDKVAIDEAKFIHILHPAEVDSDERAAWQAHFEDYEVTSPLGQWDIPVYEADTKELEAKQITRQDLALLNRGTFGGFMDKWGYLKQAAEDGAMVNGHTWLVSHKEWLVTCDHSGVSVFFDPDEEVTIQTLTPHRYTPEGEYAKWQPVALKELPLALRATLLAQAEALKSASTV